MIQTKLQLVTLVYNGGFQNKMHYILRVLKLEFTIFGLLLHLCCFGICLLAFIGLDYYTTKNTFNDMVISNLTKLYNITYAFSFTQDYIFQNKHSIFENTLYCMHNFNFDGFKY